MLSQTHFDVIIIGGGHAGTEAALASARMGCKTLLLTQNIETIGQMSCNPAIGGIGKGHLVKEIDALGGVMAEAADHAGIQFRTLNASKGPAVRATRAQADRQLYRQYIRQQVEKQENLFLFQQNCDDLIIENDQICGVKTQSGICFYTKQVVLTTGTFLGGKIFIGFEQFAGGRAGDPPSNRLAARLRELPLTVDRLKTGTPPRIDSKTINYSVLQPQPGDTPLPVFSYLGKISDHPQQIPCHITYTNQQTHDIIQSNIQQSSMYSGMIEGIGPRYCPSIEDKIMRFADKDHHQIFVEPEGLHSTEVYPNGVSTSLPFEVQQQFIRSMVGFEQAFITRPGYAIEYDFFDPRDLKQSLECKFIQGLYFAGQINGTTGYEEAGAQGLIAGINAALRHKEQDPWIIKRDEGYIGVLIDDLTTLGTKEPYRMFTSRAEYRLLLREDNADRRLTAKGYKLGVVDEQRWQFFNNKIEKVTEETQRLQKSWIHTKTENAKIVDSFIKSPLQKEVNLIELLRRPEVNYKQLMRTSFGPGLDHQQAIQQIEIDTKYAGYISRQQQEILRQQKNEETKLSTELAYDEIKGLSSEVIDKLSRFRPETIGQASRISGITPAAISILLIYLKKQGMLRKHAS